jgi:hypothetical protein
MKAIVKSFASTPNDFASVKSFGLLNEVFVSGSLVCFQEFDSVDSAKDYLTHIARNLYSDNFKDMVENLWSYGLTFQNTSAIILTGEQLESFKIIIDNQKSQNHV